MDEIIRIERVADVAALAAGDVAPVDAALAARHAPDLHLALQAGGRLAARCSLWWHAAPAWPDAKLGVIGHYAAARDEDGARLLGAAASELARAGCGLAVGPMDGNTWRSYRLVTERGTEPPFLLEPDTPDAWRRQFEGAGFTPLATYHSSLAMAPFQHDPRIPAVAARLEATGVTLRDVDLGRFEAELAAIHELSLASFARNFLYTPIDRAEFVAQYLPVAARVDPRLVFVAEHDGRLIGFLFAIADWLEAARTGKPPTTVILKSVAVDPTRRFAGLGSWMVAVAHERAEALGYRRAIHALMHDANKSSNISNRYATVMRRYALYASPLA
jgi:GNAT superfamily N-acetyltransferase